MAARALDIKYFQQQMNYIILVQIGNLFIQFVMTFLVRPSTKATQPVLLFWTSFSTELKIELFTQHLIQIQNNYKKCFRLIYVPYIAKNHSTMLKKVSRELRFKWAFQSHPWMPSSSILYVDSPFLAIISPFIPYVFFRKQIGPTYLLLIFHSIVNSHFFA